MLSNLLLPWRWKRKVDEALNAKFDLNRMVLTSVVEEVRRRLEDEMTELGEGIIAVLQEMRGEVDTRLAVQDAKLSELGAFIPIIEDACTRLEAQLAGHGKEVSELREETYDLRQSLTAEYDDMSLHRLRSAAADVRRGLAALKNEIAAQLGYSFHDMASQVADQRLWLERIAADLASHKARLEKLDTEANNGIAHLNTSLHTRLNTLQNVELPELGEQIHELAAAQIRFAADRVGGAGRRAHPEERYVPAKPQPFEAYLADAEREFPKVFEMWRERLERVQAAFDETKIGNAAHPGDLYSRIFRDFVQIHASGRVLDVGCGVFGRPYYLDAYPAELISGLEPLPMREPGDFELVRGIGEYLPWPDGSFSTVISATSLDHCLSLQRCLDEMARVLRPGGRLLLWIGSTPGAPSYDPDKADFEPADQYHLFHFDKAWLEPLLDERFALLDSFEFKRPGYAHILYSLSPRQARGAEIAAIPRGRVAAGSA